MKKIIILITIISFSFSCSKNRPKTNFDILTENEWGLTEKTIEPGFYNDDGELITDLLSILAKCREDDIYNFSTKGFLRRIGCNNTYAGYDSKQWVFNKDETKIIFTNHNKIIDTFNIIEINNKILKLEETQYEGIIIRMTFETK